MKETKVMEAQNEDEVGDIEKAGLRYVTDRTGGIHRERVKDNEFRYVTSSGAEVTSEKTLKRIKSLVIPPAWENVWICASPNGYLQATGFDVKKRKQYRYHPDYSQVRHEKKFDRMLAFGKALPGIRERIGKDLGKKGLPKEKVLAIVVSLLDVTKARIGNKEYATKNKSFGLTTLRDRHLKENGREMRLEFVGKKGIKHIIPLRNKRLARLVKQCKDIPGQELFQYVDSDGNRKMITSEDVNAYLREASEGEFTAKDFRTWGGSTSALKALLETEIPETEKELKKVTLDILKTVSQTLNNTVAVCRSYYVHPKVFESVTLKEFQDYRKEYSNRDGQENDTRLYSEEELFLTLLEKC